MQMISFLFQLNVFFSFIEKDGWKNIYFCRNVCTFQLSFNLVTFV